MRWFLKITNVTWRLFIALFACINYFIVLNKTLDSGNYILPLVIMTILFFIILIHTIYENKKITSGWHVDRHMYKAIYDLYEDVEELEDVKEKKSTKLYRMLITGAFIIFTLIYIITILMITFPKIA